jgi:hypothetical protein
MQEPKPKAKNVMRGKANTKSSMAPAESYGDFNKSAKPVNVVRGKINRPDTPLAMSPEPYGDFRKSTSVMRGKINK